MKTKKEIKKKIAKEIDLIKYPLISEKAVGFVDKENKITFIVNDNANKKTLKEYIEKTYNVKVAKINIIRDTKSRKKAMIKLKKEFKASELATKLGVI